MNQKKIYAAYGSNMNLSQMEKRCPAAEKICISTLKNYQLEFRGGGVATIIPEQGSEVPIVLWNITKGCEKLLDIYEGFPRLYVKDNIQIESEIGVVTAMVYVMAANYSKFFSKPSYSYFDTIKEGYLQNEIELDQLRSALERCSG